MNVSDFGIRDISDVLVEQWISPEGEVDAEILKLFVPAIANGDYYEIRLKADASKLTCQSCFPRDVEMGEAGSTKLIALSSKLKKVENPHEAIVSIAEKKTPHGVNLIFATDSRQEITFVFEADSIFLTT